MRSGDLALAEIDVREAIGITDEAGSPIGAPFAIAMLIVVLVERDELAAAAALVEAHVAEQLATDPSELYANHYLLNGRGRLRTRSG